MYNMLFHVFRMKLCQFTSREPSPKMQVRMGVDNMVMMVKITATQSVLEVMRNSYVLIAHSCTILPCYQGMEINAKTQSTITKIVELGN